MAKDYRTFQLTRKGWIILFACLYLGACASLKLQMGKNGAVDHRGIRFNHDVHTEQGMDCTDCHELERGAYIFPKHELCSYCHDIPEEKPTESACGFCHTDPAYVVRPWTTSLARDSIFSHEPHVAKGVTCSTCHENVDHEPVRDAFVKPTCMTCHEKIDASLNECSVCHETLTKETIPTHRGDMRIAHDTPFIWERVHGREARNTPQYCAQCHENEDSCTACHRVQKPMSHTASWRRRTHGLQATWDRQRCAVCHEEDSCAQCHQHTRPFSHRGNFGNPGNGHCVQCHFPSDAQNCGVCHEAIEHQSARPSPHALNIYPEDCGRCHPGGIPTRAPHPTNGSARCTVCHR